MKTAGTLFAIAALALAAAPAVAAPREYGGISFTTTRPGASTGTVLDVYFQNPDDPTQKPYAVETMVIDGPPGTLVDTTVPPQCHATDAEIYLMGPAACPGDSQIGSGDAW